MSHVHFFCRQIASEIWSGQYCYLIYFLHFSIFQNQVFKFLKSAKSGLPLEGGFISERPIIKYFTVNLMYLHSGIKICVWYLSKQFKCMLTMHAYNAIYFQLLPNQTKASPLKYILQRSISDVDFFAMIKECINSLVYTQHVSSFPYWLCANWIFL